MYTVYVIYNTNIKARNLGVNIRSFPPDIAQTHSVGDAREGKVPLAAPGAPLALHLLLLRPGAGAVPLSLLGLVFAGDGS